MYRSTGYLEPCQHGKDPRNCEYCQSQERFGCKKQDLVQQVVEEAKV